MIVNIPYITAPGEASRTRRNFILIFMISVVPLVAAIAGIMFIDLPVDADGFKQFSFHTLTFASH